VGENGARITCVVADDHPALVSAVCDVLEEKGIEVLARARNGDEALARIEEHQPTVALVDLRMPRRSGIEVARAAAESSPSTHVAVYTGYGDRGLIVDALDAGAEGVILKEAPLADVVRAIEMVAAGEGYVDPVLAETLAEARANPLSRREREILRLLAEGQSNEEMGRALFISPETVRSDIGRAMEKLGACTRGAAVATALRSSLIG
jgi:DNA-binding NarL/FixJ family response regulator